VVMMAMLRPVLDSRRRAPRVRSGPSDEDESDRRNERDREHAQGPEAGFDVTGGSHGPFGIGRAGLELDRVSRYWPLGRGGDTENCRSRGNHHKTSWNGTIWRSAHRDRQVWLGCSPDGRRERAVGPRSLRIVPRSDRHHRRGADRDDGCPARSVRRRGPDRPSEAGPEPDLREAAGICRGRGGAQARDHSIGTPVPRHAADALVPARDRDHLLPDAAPSRSLSSAP
jgi:hypothetical protein